VYYAYKTDHIVVPRPEKPFETLFASTIGKFALILICSIGVGLAYGIFASLITKYFPCLTRNAALETFLMFIILYLSYDTSDSCLGSGAGVVSIITCGITMTTYTYYNLSTQGRNVSG